MKNKKIGIAIICSCLILSILALSGCPAFDFNQIIDTSTSPYTTTPPPTQDTAPPLPQITSDSVQLAYEDDFSNADSGWRQSSDAEVAYSYQNGKYNISVSTAGFTYSASNSSVGEQDNFVVEVDARVLSSADTSEYGILFRRNDNNDFYGFRITGNQYTVDKYFQGEWFYLQPATASSYIKTDGSTNTLMVACLGTTIEVYVNGQRLVTVEDDSLTNGKISLSASEANTSVSFDNFRLYQFTNSYIAVAAPYLPIIATTSLPDGEVGVKYYEILTASGGNPPYFWTLAKGTLPEGLSLDSTTGIITGAPEMEGEYDFSVKLTTGSGETTQELSIYVSELVISTDSLAIGIMNVPYNQVLEASGGQPPYIWSIVSGSLPAGLVLDAAGTISGISPEAGGPFTSVFQVVDRAGATATEGLSLTVKLGDFAAIDQYVDDTPSSAETAIGTLVNYLVQPCRTDLEKARVIYRWIAQNIDYDVYTYVSGLYKTPNCPDQSAEAVFARRNGICEGYSRLFLKMAEYAGLPAVYILGWGRMDYTEEGYAKDHAWNAVQVNGVWQLVDSTWGAGYMEEESYFVRSFDDFWFLTPPEQFIYTHYPDDASWQLLTPTVPVAEVAYYPVVASDYFTYGLQLGIYNQGIYTVTNMGASINIQAPPDALLMASLFQNDTQLEDSLVFYQRQENTYRIDALFPYAADYELRIYVKWKTEPEQYHQALKYKLIAEQSLNYQAGFPTTFDLFNTKGAYLYSPLTGSLPAGTSQYFQIMIPGAKEVAVVTNQDTSSASWQYLKKEGQMFQGSIDITTGKIMLGARFTNDNLFSWLVEYSGE